MAGNNAVALHWDNTRALDPRLPLQWGLEDRHLKYLMARGIDRETACHAGIFSATEDIAEQLVGLRASGLIFPYWEPGGEALYSWCKEGLHQPFYRMRLDIPQGKKKFHSPRGSKVLPYWPKVPGVSWVEKAHYGYAQPCSVASKDVFMTEGECKALCATSTGLPTIGLNGVWGWKVTKQEALIPELADYTWGIIKRLIGVFDSDVSSNPDVERAMQRMGHCVLNTWVEQWSSQTDQQITPRLVQRLNNKLAYILLPNRIPAGPEDKDTKLGLDDFIAEFGAAAVKILATQSLPLQQVKVDPNTSNFTVNSSFYGDPLGPGHHTEKGRWKGLMHIHNAKNYRRLMASFTIADKHRWVPGQGGYQYCREQGIWKLMPRKLWESLPEQVCQTNGWSLTNEALKKEDFSTAKTKCLTDFGLFDPPDLVGFKNGVLVRKGGSPALVPHSKSHLLTRRLDFDYNPAAGCPRWLSYLQEFTHGQTDEIWLLRALMRWTLEPKKKGAKFPLEVWPILLGPPGCGKGTFLYVLRGLLGEQGGYANFTIRALNSPEVEKKLGAFEGRYAIIDADFKGRITEEGLGELNKIISNESVTTKFLYQEPRTTTLDTVVWAAMNKMPALSNADAGGFGRRAIIIQLKPLAQKEDTRLGEKLLQELPGIYNWIMDLPLIGAETHIRSYREGRKTAIIQKVRAIESNSVAGWLEEYLYGEQLMAQTLEQDMETWQPAVMLVSEYYALYQQWIEQNGMQACGRKTFTRYLQTLGATPAERTKLGVPIKLPHPDEVTWKNLT